MSLNKDAAFDYQERFGEVYRLLLVASLSLIFLFIRKPDSFFHPDFWAEDGKLFWHEFIAYGFDTFFRPYAGYLVLTPRTIAAAASLFPVRYAVDLYLTGAVIFTMWTSITIALSVAGFVGILAALAPLLAYGAQETLATPTNIQWPMACAMGVIAVGPLGAARAIQVNNAVFLVFSALTGPFSIFAAPLFAIRASVAWRKHALCDIAVSVIALLGAATQVYLLLKDTPAATGTSAPKVIPMAYHLIFHAVGSSPIGLIAVAVAIFSLFFGRFRLQRAGLGLIATAILATTLIKFIHHAGIFSTGIVGNRYWYVPSVIILLSVIFLLRERTPWLRWMGVIGIATFMAGFLHRPFIAPAQQHFGTWATAIDSGATEYKFPPGWVVNLQGVPLGHHKAPSLQ